MSKLKKILLMALSLVLVAAMSIGGTVAYLQDDDSDVNVMTLGSVYIRQNEEQRVDPSKNGTLTDADIEDFEQAKPIYPYVDENLNNAMSDDYEEITFPDGNTYKLFIGDNAIDKLVSVTNTGKSDAYVRTIIALEAPTDKIDLSFNAKGDAWAMDKTASSYSIEVDGVKYDLFVCVYNNPLKPGETTPYSLMQIILDGTATNEDAAAYGNTYDVLVLSQAIQTAGFEDATTALNTGFGVVDADSAAEWFKGVIVPRVKTVAELREALATGGEFALANDIVVEASDLLYAADGGHSDGSAFFVKNDTVIDLNGHDIKVTSGNAWSDVFFMKFGADLTIKGEGDIEADCSIACVYDANSTLNVEGGNFYVTANNDMLYAIYGKINVSGGTFTTSYWNTINIYGSGRVDRVDVSGGSFENWNPASSPDGNLLADGYKSVSEVVDGVTWYKVVAE